MYLFGSINNKAASLCMINNNKDDNFVAMKPSLPAFAHLPINRCNLSPVIIGSLSFQHHPTALHIDGIDELHKALFKGLNIRQTHQQRANYFMDYMIVHFRMENLEDAGLMNDDKNKRSKADYLRILRGWLFDTDSREAAVLKSWVESRFGLLARYHKGELNDYTNENYHIYLQERSIGLYATNALEAQIDLLYSYCQYELALQHKENQRIPLYRGINKIDSYEILKRQGKNQAVILMNNINSFTRNRERADEFGDYILEADIPWQKVLFYSNLLPGLFSGEDEVLVIGGVYEVKIAS